jgi:hypothetical protein
MKHFWMAVIATGLWANAAALWTRPAQAQIDHGMTYYLERIDDNIQTLVRGGIDCRNTKICP